MKSSISLLLVITCAVVLADGTTEEQYRTDNCSVIYGHSCWGGMGKRSVRSLTSDAVGIGSAGGNGQDDVAILQLLPEGEFDAYPRYWLIKIMKSWFRGQIKRPSERMSNADYSISGEAYSRDGNNALN